ncbi:tetratricopeptide (TPR) repeat protein [Croceifilum oryzae]|uniref:Tetratricopeptide (TPR) repeat protein n=1 Tax=Croceifilum oryzae TaxID=1553429 RepID=A0AAJ1TL10_9BACL|nr:helix-turn-helix transcriptional regulator [Croceifilum oryzae]MDQ0418442.1 tetratricopeptide (TPR) repeat protein [Croceifilum oryzae]
MKIYRIDPKLDKLIQSNLKEIGMLIRKLRNEKGLRLIDLGDLQASTSTISNLERSKGNHKSETAVHLFDKLGVSAEDIPTILERERASIYLIDFQLQSTEAFLRLGQTEKALHELEQIEIYDFHYLAPKYYYFNGRCMKSKKQWDQAEKFFRHAIDLLVDATNKEDNIEAACYLELAYSKHHNNELAEALDLTKKGISAFVSGGDRQHNFHSLLLNQSILCSKLNLYPEGILALNQLETFLDLIKDSTTILKYYWLKAEYAKEYGDSKEALRFAQKGLELAGMSESFSMFMEFWLWIGDCLASLGKFSEAEVRFKKALEFEHSMIETRTLISVNLRIGTLYLKEEMWDKAEPFATTARELSITQNDAPNLFVALLLSGDIEIGLGNHSSAVKYYEQAQVIAHRYHYIELEIQAWTQLAKCWEPVNLEQFQYCAGQAFKLQNSTILKGD